jgi:hypothetical protein
VTEVGEVTGVRGEVSAKAARRFGEVKVCPAEAAEPGMCEWRTGGLPRHATVLAVGNDRTVRTVIFRGEVEAR